MGRGQGGGSRGEREGGKGCAHIFVYIPHYTNAIPDKRDARYRTLKDRTGFKLVS